MASSRKRARMSTNDNFILPDEILTKIVKFTPLAQWPKLELVSKRVRRCVKIAYKSLLSLNLNDIILPEFGKYSKSLWNFKLEQCLTKLVGCCPRLQTICGFDCSSDSISPSHFDLIQEFTELKNISFDNCRLNVGDLSEFLKKIPLMKSLAIRNCEFWHDSLKPSISTYDRIAKLNIFFGFYGKFSGLLDLTINGIVWSFSGDFLSLVNADYLKVLNFSGSKFKGHCVFPLLNRCTNLEILQLYDPLTDFLQSRVGLELKVLQCLPRLPKLREFHLHINDEAGLLLYTSDDLLDVLVQCNMLKNFRLRCARHLIVLDNFLDGLITGCPLLETLNLDTRCFASKETIAKIAALRCLCSLSIVNSEERCNMLNALGSALQQLNKLSCLAIRAPFLKNPGMLSLKMPESLTSFTYGGHHLTKTQVQRWIKAGFLKRLKVLKLFSNVTDSIVESIAENAPILESFHLHGEINDDTLLTIAENCRRLEILDLKMCIGMSEKGLLKFLSKCNALKRLFVHSSFASFIPKNRLFQPYKHMIWLDFAHR